MRRRAIGIRLGLAALWMAAALPAAQASSLSGTGQAAIPLPRGIRGLPEPTRVDLGASTLYVHAFAVRMEDEALVAFYEQALPSAGWRIEQLPWQADQEKAVSGLKRALTYHRQAMDDTQRQETEAWLGRLEEGRKSLRRELYATNGVEHVIINLWPLKEGKGTTVFINRWSGSRQWLGVGSQYVQGSGLGVRGTYPEPRTQNPEPSDVQSGFPMKNVCCSGEEVPDLQGALPFSIPRYPGAKAVARTTPPGGVSTTVLLMVPDSEPAVTAYYRSEMAAGGWKLLDEEGEGKGSGAGVRHLRFQRPDRICELTIAAPAPGKTGAGGPHTLVTVAVRPRVQGGMR